MKSQIHMMKAQNECRHCGEGFVSPKNLERHAEERHGGGGGGGGGGRIAGAVSSTVQSSAAATAVGSLQPFHAPPLPR